MNEQKKNEKKDDSDLKKQESLIRGKKSTEKNTTKTGAFELSDHHNGNLRGQGRFKFWRSNGRQGPTITVISCRSGAESST